MVFNVLLSVAGIEEDQLALAGSPWGSREMLLTPIRQSSLHAAMRAVDWLD